MAMPTLGSWRFVDSNDVIEVLTSLFNSVTFGELERVFQRWIR
jgi:hypothetical protein